MTGKNLFLTRLLIFASFGILGLTGCSTYTYQLDETAIHPNQPVKITHTEKPGWSGLPSEMEGRPKLSFTESFSTPQISQTTPAWPEGALVTWNEMADISSEGGHIRKISLRDNFADWYEKRSITRYGKSIYSDYDTPIEGITADQVAEMMREVNKKYKELPPEAFKNSGISATTSDLVAFQEADIDLLAPKIAQALQTIDSNTIIQFTAENRESKPKNAMKGTYSFVMSLAASANRNDAQAQQNANKAEDQIVRPTRGYLWVEKSQTPYYTVNRTSPKFTQEIYTAKALPVHEIPKLVFTFFRTGDKRNFEKLSAYTVPPKISIEFME